MDVSVASAGSAADARIDLDVHMGSSDRCMLVVDGVSDEILDANAMAATRLGWPVAELVGRMLPAVLAEDAASDRADAAFERRYVAHDADGREARFLRFDVAAAQAGRPVKLVNLIDTTRSDRDLFVLREERHFLERVIQAIPAAIFVKDVRDGGRYVLGTGAVKALASLGERPLVGATDRELFPKATAAEYADSDREVCTTGRMLISEATLYQPDGSVLVTETRKLAVREPSGPPRYVLGLTEDITARREMELRLARLAMRDPLTGLANRTMFRERLRSALAQRQKVGGFVVLHCLDLDHFKGVNDSLGHAAGDRLLIEIANRIEQACDPRCVVARLGGDEFAVVQGPIAAIDEAADLAGRIARALSRPADIDGKALAVGASAGLAIAPDHGDDTDTLVRSADVALYGAKEQGRGSYRFFDAALADRMHVRTRMEEDLREAIATRQFQLCYQPILDLRSQAISGYEALLRWPHPTRGMVPPSVLVPLAEETGLMLILGEWVLQEACREAARWPGGRVSVNLSPVQFRNPGLTACVEAALAAAGLAPERLELEITESVLLDDTRANVDTLHRLRGLGVHIALDDFGTGYSSLGYLGAFPFQKIKIDQSLVREIVTNAKGLAIVRSVLKLAQDLGMATTAEGVETQAQLDILSQEGCAEVQGYLIDRPRPAGEIAWRDAAGSWAA